MFIIDCKFMILDSSEKKDSLFKLHILDKFQQQKGSCFLTASISLMIQIIAKNVSNRNNLVNIILNCMK